MPATQVKKPPLRALREARVVENGPRLAINFLTASAGVPGGAADAIHCVKLNPGKVPATAGSFLRARNSSFIAAAASCRKQKTLAQSRTWMLLANANL